MMEENIQKTKRDDSMCVRGALEDLVTRHIYSLRHAIYIFNPKKCGVKRPME